MRSERVVATRYVTTDFSLNHFWAVVPLSLYPFILQATEEYSPVRHSSAHETGAAGEHALDGEFGPVAEGVAVFIKVLAPAVVMLEQQLCWVAEYTLCRV